MSLAYAYLLLVCYDGLLCALSIVISGLGWGPKDDTATWVALFVTVLLFDIKRGLDLRSWVKWTFADESKGLRKALQLIFPSSTADHIDLRH
jgi:hypothetical protein